VRRVLFEQHRVPEIARQYEIDTFFFPHLFAPTWRPPRAVVTVHDSADRLALLSESTADLLEAGTIQRLETAEADEFRVDTVLASPDAAAKG